MKIQDKIATILRLNKLGVNSIFALEKRAGLGVGSLSKHLPKGQNPSLGTVKKIQDAFNINPEWWDTGKGEVFLDNHTSVQERSDNTEKPDKEKMLDVLKEALQEGSEYRLIPKTVLDGEYVIMAKRELEQRAKDADQRAKEYEDRRLERQDTINSLHKVIKVYEDEIARLSSLVNTAAQKAQ